MSTAQLRKQFENAYRKRRHKLSKTAQSLFDHYVATKTEPHNGYAYIINALLHPKNPPERYQ